MAAKLAFLFLLAFIAYGQSDPLLRDDDKIRKYAEFLEKSVDGKPMAPATPELEYLQNEWERSGKYEGDIVLSEGQREALVSSFIGNRNALRDFSKLWPRNIVYYSFAPSHFNTKQKRIIRKAMDEIKSKTCIKFIERTNQNNYTLITGKYSGCYSSVGYIGGAQGLNLAVNDCLDHGSVIHELLHTIGLHHMQSTYDRDDWVRILWDNIEPDTEHNFYKLSEAEVTNLGIKYDYGSCMHYSEYAFTIDDDSKTIEPIRDTGNITIGECLHMSPSDVRRINRLYKCPKK